MRPWNVTLAAASADTQTKRDRAGNRGHQLTERLRMELDDATGELSAHLHSWEYAFAMGASCHGGTNHPMLREARAKTARLERRYGDLRARLAEHE
jgi:hypothetical protein